MKVIHLLEAEHQKLVQYFSQHSKEILDALYDILDLPQTNNSNGEPHIAVEIMMAGDELSFMIDIPGYDDIEFAKRVHAAAVKSVLSDFGKIEIEVEYNKPVVVSPNKASPNKRSLPPYVTVRVLSHDYFQAIHHRD